jgi:hypothetical protein
MEYIKKVTQEIIEKILSKGVRNMPQNPSAQGLTAAQIREFYYVPEKMMLELIAELENAVAEAFKRGYSKEDVDEMVNGITEDIANRYTKQEVKDEISNELKNYYKKNEVFNKQETYSSKEVDDKLQNLVIGDSDYLTYDINGNAFPTYNDLISATTFYYNGQVVTPNKNDYAVVLTDNTHNNSTCRYVFNGNWIFQYVIEKEPLSQAQLDALNSGITADKVAQIGQGGNGGALPDNLDSLVKESIVNNNETLTDDEKTSACGWLGALKKVETTGLQRAYGITGAGKQTLYPIISSEANADVGRIPLYVKNESADSTYSNEKAVLATGTPKKPYHCVPKKYVDDLFESVSGGGSGGGTKLYLHKVTIHSTGISGITENPAFDLVVNVISSKDVAYTNNDLAFVIANWYKLASVEFSNTTNALYLGSFVPTMFVVNGSLCNLKVLVIENEAHTLPYEEILVSGSASWLSITNDDFSAL